MKNDVEYAWTAAAALMEEAPATWVKVFKSQSPSSVTSVRKRDVIALRGLRAAGRVEIATRGNHFTEDGRKRCEVWARWIPNGVTAPSKTPPSKLRLTTKRDQSYRSFQLPKSLAEAIQATTDAADVATGFYLEQFVKSVNQTGSDVEPEPEDLKATLNFRVSTTDWEKFRSVAEERGVSVSELAVHELNKRFGEAR